MSACCTASPVVPWRSQRTAALTQRFRTISLGLKSNIRIFEYENSIRILMALFEYLIFIFKTGKSVTLSGRMARWFIKQFDGKATTGVPSDGSRTFSWGAVGPWFVVGGHSVRTTTGLLLRTILCKSLVLMPRVKFVEKIHKTCILKSLQ